MGGSTTRHKHIVLRCPTDRHQRVANNTGAEAGYTRRVRARGGARRAAPANEREDAWGGSARIASRVLPLTNRGGRGKHPHALDKRPASSSTVCADFEPVRRRRIQDVILYRSCDPHTAKEVRTTTRRRIVSIEQIWEPIRSTRKAVAAIKEESTNTHE
jgi:hypothetical protein